MIFGSSDNKDSTLWPKLVVEYDTTKPWTGPSVTLRPGAAGKDALLFSRKDQTGTNLGHAIQFQAGTWTWDADGFGQGTHRSLIEFDLKSIPAEAKVHSARLLLACDTVNYTKGHSSLSKSDAAWLMRVKEAWAETTVTWANQPAADTAGRITLEESKKAKQNYEVDVTAMVAAMVADSTKNHGFLLRSITESPYNYLTFGSGDHKDSTLHPALVVEYENQTTRAGRARAGKEILASRAAAQGLRFRVAARELILSRPETVEILSLNGARVGRSANSATVSLAGIRAGTYILKSASTSAMLLVP
jgi:hypothetical protein